MSTYAARLERLSKIENTAEGTEEMSQFTRLSLQEMGKTKVDFGEAHQGQTYEYVWSHHKTWLKFILNKYGESPKIQHRKLVHYTTMMIERTELEQGLPEQMPVKPKILKTVPKPKAKAPPGVSSEMAGELSEDPEEVESFIEVEYMNQQHMQQQENIEALQSRMLHMEGAITEILGHLRNQ